MELLELLAKTIGFITIFKALVSLIRWAWIGFLRPPKNLKEYGSWAVVTGSTDGIGKALAFELASKGLHLLLVGRNPTKLKVTTKELHQRYHGSGLKVRTVVIDFSTDPLEVIGSRIQEGIDGLDVGILINNAGMCNAWPRLFHEADSMVDDIIRVNLESVCRVTKAVLPMMIKKKKGAIVNIGSGSAVLPSFPSYSIYSSTKAFIHHFSKGLNIEYKQHGIDVQCQIPMFVATKMLPQIPFSSFFIPTPEVYSKACLRWIGYEPVCIPYWIHSLEGALIHAIPKAFMGWISLQYALHLRSMEKFTVPVPEEAIKGESQVPNEPPLEVAQPPFAWVISMFLGPWCRFGPSSGPMAKQDGA